MAASLRDGRVSREWTESEGVSGSVHGDTSSRAVVPALTQHQQHQHSSTMSYDSNLLDIPNDMRSCRGLSDKVALFNKQVDEHKERQSLNPFTEDGRRSPRPKFDRHDADYGRPVSGSKTDLRGKKAHTHINKEVLELCNVINENGETMHISKDEVRVVISFGELFSIYTYISSKVVGLLLRARKQKLVDFEGETLFQRRDDDVPIILCKTIEEIREHFKEQTNGN